MSTLRALLDRQHALLFAQGRPLERLKPLFDAADAFLFTPGTVTRGAPHVRDGLNLQRVTIAVMVALAPCIVWAMYHTGYQAALAAEAGAASQTGWQHSLFRAMGWSHDRTSILGNFFFGALVFVPVYVVTLAAGGLIEITIAGVRKRAMDEGILVTCTLFSLLVPAGIGLSQAALGIAFGVLIGRIAFGSGGLYRLNPALAGCAFVLFVFPDQFESAGALRADHDSWMHAFVGLAPDAMGNASVLCCVVGGAVLVVSGVRSWRTIVGCVAGVVFGSLVFNAIGAQVNPIFSEPFYWHWVSGGFAFGAVFLATDPLSSAITNRGKFIHGFGVGTALLLFRAFGSAGAPDVALAILGMGALAPLIDAVVIRANVRRRQARYAE